jgi:hypothetical protein
MKFRRALDAFLSGYLRAAKFVFLVSFTATLVFMLARQYLVG